MRSLRTYYPMRVDQRMSLWPAPSSGGLGSEGTNFYDLLQRGEILVSMACLRRRDMSQESWLETNHLS